MKQIRTPGIGGNQKLRESIKLTNGVSRDYSSISSQDFEGVHNPGLMRRTRRIFHANPRRKMEKLFEGAIILRSTQEHYFSDHVTEDFKIVV